MDGFHAEKYANAGVSEAVSQLELLPFRNMDLTYADSVYAALTFAAGQCKM